MTQVERSVNERRCGVDRRNWLKVSKLLYNGPEKRKIKDRRSHGERRDGWVRTNRWSSVCLSDLKIAKYLKP